MLEVLLVDVPDVVELPNGLLLCHEQVYGLRLRGLRFLNGFKGSCFRV